MLAAHRGYLPPAKIEVLKSGFQGLGTEADMEWTRHLGQAGRYATISNSRVDVARGSNALVILTGSNDRDISGYTVPGKHVGSRARAQVAFRKILVATPD